MKSTEDGSNSNSPIATNTTALTSNNSSHSSSTSSHHLYSPPGPPGVPATPPRSRRPHPHREPVQFLSTLQFIPVPPSLLQGVPIILVAANGKTQSAKVLLSKDKFTIWIQTTKRSLGTFLFGRDATHTRVIDIGEVDRIQKGSSTQQFEKAKKKKGIVVQPPVSSSMSQAHPRLLRSNSTSSHASESGASTTSSIQMLQQLDPSLSCSIIFRGAQTLDFMAPSPYERDMIADTLDRVMRAYQQAKKRVSNEVLLLRYVWLHAADDIRGSLTEKTLHKVLLEINMLLRGKDMGANYEKFGRILKMNRMQRRQGLSFEQSCMFLHYIRRNSWTRKPIDVIWEELFGSVMKNFKTRETLGEYTFLERFLQQKQGHTNASIVDVRKIFRKLHDMELLHVVEAAVASSTPRLQHSNSNLSLERISKDHFEAYLLASDNDAFNPKKELLDMDSMTRPLSEYWISSSHNTYLIGDQYTSHSSVEMYSNALYRGCRCLELDIWDGPKSSPTPVPVVWHGHTMTTKILFVDILKTIKVFLSFHPTTFPIILSFENHCTLPYQEVMADMLVKILGDQLYIPTEASLHGELPSPKQLQGMVVIKGRRPEGTEADAYDSDEYDLSYGDADGDDHMSIGSGDEDASGGGTSSSRAGGESAIEVMLERADAMQKPNHEKLGVSPNLARLVLLHGTKHHNWYDSTRSPRYHMHSFNENKVRSKCRQKEIHTWIKYNQQHLSRTYPAGSRVDSSNYNPLLAWSTGCQLVALNFQTQDSFLRLNDGRFRENGNCGYVLKPSELMAQDPNYVESPVRMSIRILNGSCLPKSKGSRSGDCIEPYVKVSVFDVKKNEKESVMSYPTSVAPSNGFCPIWLQAKFSFTVEKWSVAMLQLTVLDKAKDEFIASASIPTSCLRRGIRSVKLYDATNTRSGAFDFARLLVDIKLGHMTGEI